MRECLISPISDIQQASCPRNNKLSNEHSLRFAQIPIESKWYSDYTVNTVAQNNNFSYISTILSPEQQNVSSTICTNTSQHDRITLLSICNAHCIHPCKIFISLVKQLTLLRHQLKRHN